MRALQATRGWAPPVALASMLVAAGCGGSASVGDKTLKGDAVESQIADKIFEQRQVRPKSIDCPAELEAEKGKTYECKLTAPNGDTLPVTVTINDDEGAYKFEVGQEITPGG